MQLDRHRMAETCRGRSEGARFSIADSPAERAATGLVLDVKNRLALPFPAGSLSPSRGLVTLASYMLGARIYALLLSCFGREDGGI